MLRCMMSLLNFFRQIVNTSQFNIVCSITSTTKHQYALIHIQTSISLTSRFYRKIIFEIDYAIAFQLSLEI